MVSNLPLLKTIECSEGVNKDLEIIFSQIDAILEQIPLTPAIR